MEIKYLRLVKSIVENGSLAKSKDKLHLTQSALSHQLKEAESLAGTTLFERVNKKLVLTNAGELVYKTAIEVLEKVDDLSQNIKEIAAGDRGVVRLCTACFTNYYWLPGLISRFNLIHPNVEIKVHPEYINECLERLKKHELDGVIMNKPEPDKNIQFFELIEDEMVALINPHDQLKAKKYLKASDFDGRNLIIFSNPINTVVVYEKVLKPAGVKPLRVYEVPMTEAMIEMVASGMGLAVIPYWIARPYIDSGKVIPLRVTAKGLHRSLVLAYLKKSSYPKYFYSLLEFLKQNLGKGVVSNSENL
jgi:LysR family transcriptional regulator for metE and metH